MTAPMPRHRFCLTRPLIVLAGLWLAAAAATGAALVLGGWTGQWPEAMGAAGVCGGAALASLMLTGTLARRGGEGIVQGALAGMLARMVLSLAGAAALVLGLGLSQTALAGWTLGWYLLLLVAEVVLVVRCLQGASDAAAPGSAPSLEAVSC
ncbi:MAG TPA: hypothetical protein VF184_06585 [Phycisphaeraceae bacterium]